MSRNRPSTIRGTTRVPPARSSPPAWQLALLSLGLFLLVAWTFFPSTRNGFTDYDDDVYVTANAQVQSGLSPASVAWAMGSTAGGNYWHPLTWLSHMLDCQLFGLNASGHHLVSLLIHAFNTVLVFWVLRQMTGTTWRSLTVAVLFGLHPLRVESVAWVAERKDVLSGLCWLLALWAYVRFAQSAARPGAAQPARVAASTPNARRSTLPRSCFYLLALACFTLGLMSKPMVVTLPFVLLLLDYWPLGRVQIGGKPAPAGAGVARLVLEKVPFFLLAASASVAAYLVQTGAGVTAQQLPMSARVGNALVAYCRYLGKLFWPFDLAVLYPHPGYWPAQLIGLACLLLLGLSALLLVLGRKRPYLLVGWLWFLGTLVPVIGVVQAGAQSMADRYTYVPLIGVLVLLVWGLHDLTRGWRYQPAAAAGVVAAVAALCLLRARHQISYWESTETLFRHTIAVTRNNYIAHLRLGTTFSRQGRLDEAIAQLQEAVRIEPKDSDSHNNLGAALGRKGRLEEAIVQFQEALRLSPNDPEGHNNLGVAYGMTGRYDSAIREYEEALRQRPDYAMARSNLVAATAAKARQPVPAAPAP